MADMLAEYQRYNPGFQQMQSAKPSAFAGALPVVGAALSGVGLLSSLYGNYKASQAAEKNYREQVREFEIQRKMQQEETERQIAQQALQNKYSAKGGADNDEDRRLAKYQNYYRQIGL